MPIVYMFDKKIKIETKEKFFEYYRVPPKGLGAMPHQHWLATEEEDAVGVVYVVTLTCGLVTLTCGDGC